MLDQYLREVQEPKVLYHAASWLTKTLVPRKSAIAKVPGAKYPKGWQNKAVFAAEEIPHVIPFGLERLNMMWPDQHTELEITSPGYKLKRANYAEEVDEMHKKIKSGKTHDFMGSSGNYFLYNKNKMLAIIVISGNVNYTFDIDVYSDKKYTQINKLHVLIRTSVDILLDNKIGIKKGFLAKLTSKRKDLKREYMKAGFTVLDEHLGVIILEYKR